MFSAIFFSLSPSTFSIFFYTFVAFHVYPIFPTTNQNILLERLAEILRVFSVFVWVKFGSLNRQSKKKR